MNLFDQVLKDRQQKDAPLAARMRPRTLDEYVGQQRIREQLEIFIAGGDCCVARSRPINWAA